MAPAHNRTGWRPALAALLLAGLAGLVPGQSRAETPPDRDPTLAVNSAPLFQMSLSHSGPAVVLPTVPWRRVFFTTGYVGISGCITTQAKRLAEGASEGPMNLYMGYLAPDGKVWTWTPDATPGAWSAAVVQGLQPVATGLVFTRNSPEVACTYNLVPQQTQLPARDPDRLPGTYLLFMLLARADEPQALDFNQWRYAAFSPIAVFPLPQPGP